MPRYKLTIEYDGSPFVGWQRQANGRSVQEAIEDALAGLTGERPTLRGAGRTDAGVHALAQVAHVRVERALDPAALPARVNAHLPSDIHVLGCELAPLRFHARHAALSRAYVYQLARRRTAFAKKYVWWVERELDLERMRRALALTVGEHDFVQFCDKPKDHKSTQVNVVRAELAESGALVLLRFEASHFLWRMVRRLTGTLVDVAAGELEVAEFARLIETTPLDAARGLVSERTAPPSGLFLERVRYAGDPPPGELVPAVHVRA
jgi:tRNA pseudouridine38-40 synthase